MSLEGLLYAFDDCTVYPLPENRVLVRNPRNGRHAVLTPDVYSALTACREFRSLPEHARRLAAGNPALRGQEEAVMTVLESVQNDGLMISAQIYETKLAPANRRMSITDPPVVAIITCDRPKALGRLLESIRDQKGLQGMSSLYVIDDSRDAANREQNHHLVHEYKKRLDAPVVYFGHEQQTDFMQKLIAQLPALESAIRFLLDAEMWKAHWSGGRARTQALLLSVGQRLITLDDDVLCEVHEPPEASSGAGFANRAREAEFFASNDDWAGHKASEHTNPLDRHAKTLGLSLADSLTAMGIDSLGADSFRGAPVGFLESLKRESPVLMTECGTYGDPGTTGNEWITQLPESSLKPLLGSETAVQNALTQRNVWTGRRAPHFAPGGSMSPITGLDNRKPLPPYLPILRNEDRLFGNMLHFQFPAAVSIDLPWAVPHLPVDERGDMPGSDSFRSFDPFPGFMAGYVADQQDSSRASDPIRRLSHLARLFENLGDMNHKQLSDFNMDYRLESMSESYCRLKTLRENYSTAPGPWMDYIDKALANLNREIINNPADVRLKGYPAGLEGEPLTVWWKDFWKRFANSLQSWPAIRQAARHCAPSASETVVLPKTS